MAVDVAEVVKSIRDGKPVEVADFLRGGVDPNSRNHLGWTLLHIASLEGQAEIVDILLNNGAQVNSCTIDMCTSLHRACSQGKVKAAEVLIKKGAFVNAQDKNGNTPLHEAAKALHTPVVKLLLEKKADRTRKNKKNQIFTQMIGQQMMSVIESSDAETLVMWLDWGLSPSTFGNLNWSILHHASARGQINIASILLERGANVNALDSNKSTALHAACFHGHKRIAELLIGKGANLDQRDQLGNTPLHSAVSGAHPDIINTLLESGCDTKIENSEGQIFTHLVNEFLVDAVQNRKIAYVHSLLKGQADPDSKDSCGCPVLCCATLKGDLLIVDALLNAGGNPNVCTEDSKMTPLHYAALLGNLFILKALLDKGASVSSTNRLKSTPLHEAAREGSEDVVTVLVGRCAPMNFQDCDGNTPLHIAARWGQTKVVDLLIEKGADEIIKNKDGHIHIDLALMRAVRTENTNEVLAALAWGGDPNTKDSKGWYLLHHAVYKGALKVVKLLIESEADVNVVDKEGRTPLLLAAYRGNKEIMEELINANADLDYQDKRLQTPLHWAAAEGSISTVELLIQKGAARNIRNREGLMYSDLLLKHLYFAVRHNDAEKVECLLRAGADHSAEVNGTGTTPRDEAKRRKHYKILQRMVALTPKKPICNTDDFTAVEDISKLFEDQRRTPTFSDEESDYSMSDEYETAIEYDPDEDAYWRMHNATTILKEKDIMEQEASAFWEYWEEKIEKISFKDWGREDLEDFWEYWEEKPQVISAKDFFKEDLPWWQRGSCSSISSLTSASNSSLSSIRSDDLYMVSFEEIKKRWGTVIPAKELFKPEECWWKDAVEELESSSDERENSPLRFYTLDEVREKWGGDIISAKELFKDDECWWRDAVEELSSSSDDYDKRPTMSEIMSKWGPVLSAKEAFKDDGYWTNLFEADKSPKVQRKHSKFWWDNPRQDDEVIVKHALYKPGSITTSDNSDSESESIESMGSASIITEAITLQVPVRVTQSESDLGEETECSSINSEEELESPEPESDVSTETTSEQMSSDNYEEEDSSSQIENSTNLLPQEIKEEIEPALVNMESDIKETLFYSDHSDKNLSIEVESVQDQVTLDEWEEAIESLVSNSSVMYSALEGDFDSASEMMSALTDVNIPAVKFQIEKVISNSSCSSYSHSHSIETSVTTSDYDGSATESEKTTSSSSYVTSDGDESDAFRSSKDTFCSTSTDSSKKLVINSSMNLAKVSLENNETRSSYEYNSEVEETYHYSESSSSSDDDFEEADDEEGMFYKVEYQNPVDHGNSFAEQHQKAFANANKIHEYHDEGYLIPNQKLGIEDYQLPIPNRHFYKCSNEPMTFYYYEPQTDSMNYEQDQLQGSSNQEEYEISYTHYQKKPNKDMVLKSHSTPTNIDYYEKDTGVETADELLPISENPELSVYNQNTLTVRASSEHSTYDSPYLENFLIPYDSLEDAPYNFDTIYERGVDQQTLPVHTPVTNSLCECQQCYEESQAMIFPQHWMQYAQCIPNKELRNVSYIPEPCEQELYEAYENNTFPKSPSGSHELANESHLKNPNEPNMLVQNMPTQKMITDGTHSNVCLNQQENGSLTTGIRSQQPDTSQMNPQHTYNTKVCDRSVEETCESTHMAIIPNQDVMRNTFNSESTEGVVATEIHLNSICHDTKEISTDLDEKLAKFDDHLSKIELKLLSDGFCVSPNTNVSQKLSTDEDITKQYASKWTCSPVYKGTKDKLTKSTSNEVKASEISKLNVCVPENLSKVSKATRPYPKNWKNRRKSRDCKIFFSEHFAPILHSEDFIASIDKILEGLSPTILNKNVQFDLPEAQCITINEQILDNEASLVDSSNNIYLPDKNIPKICHPNKSLEGSEQQFKETEKEGLVISSNYKKGLSDSDFNVHQLTKLNQPTLSDYHCKELVVKRPICLDQMRGNEKVNFILTSSDLSLLNTYPTDNTLEVTGKAINKSLINRCRGAVDTNHQSDTILPNGTDTLDNQIMVCGESYNFNKLKQLKRNDPKILYSCYPGEEVSCDDDEVMGEDLIKMPSILEKNKDPDPISSASVAKDAASSKVQVSMTRNDFNFTRVNGVLLIFYIFCLLQIIYRIFTVKFFK